MNDLPGDPEGNDVRSRILGAAFALFMTEGYARTSTLAIAKRARVSKRDLYAQFGSKRAMLETCVRERNLRMTLPELPAGPMTRDSLVALLTELGARIMQEVTRPEVLALQRLAIAEAARAPEIAWVIEENGRRPAQDAFIGLLARAQDAGLVGAGDLCRMAARMTTMMWGSLLLRMLMGVAEGPDQTALQDRAHAAALDLLTLYAPGNSSGAASHAAAGSASGYAPCA